MVGVRPAKDPAGLSGSRRGSHRWRNDCRAQRRSHERDDPREPEATRRRRPLRDRRRADAGGTGPGARARRRNRRRSSPGRDHPVAGASGDGPRAAAAERPVGRPGQAGVVALRPRRRRPRDGREGDDRLRGRRGRVRQRRGGRPGGLPAGAAPSADARRRLPAGSLHHRRRRHAAAERGLAVGGGREVVAALPGPRPQLHGGGPAARVGQGEERAGCRSAPLRRVRAPAARSAELRLGSPWAVRRLGRQPGR